MSAVLHPTHGARDRGHFIAVMFGDHLLLLEHPFVTHTTAAQRAAFKVHPAQIIGEDGRSQFNLCGDCPNHETAITGEAA